MACLHLNIPSVLNNYKELKEIFNSENIAYSLLSKNNEFGLEYTPKGEPSELYKSLLNQTKDRSKALQLKAKYYTKSYLEKDNWIERGAEPNVTTQTSSIVPKLKGKMSYNYGENKRSDITSNTTLEAVKNGERTATTRYESDGNISYWKQAKVGDIIEFEGQNGEKVNVEVTKPLYKLQGSGMTPEQWSKLEGWSLDYFNKKVKPKLGEAWQMQYKVVQQNPLLEEFTISPLQKKLVQEIAQAKKERNNLEASGGRKLDINKLDNKIQDLQQRIEQLKNTEDLNDIYKEADIQLEEAKKLIDSGELSEHNFTNTLNKLQLWVTAGDFSSKDHLFLDEDLVTNKVIQDKFSELGRKAELMLVDLTNKGEIYLTNRFNEKYGTNITFKEMLQLNHKLGLMHKGLSLNRVGHALGQFILRSVVDANDAASIQAKTEANELAELYQKVKHSKFDVSNYYQVENKLIDGKLEQFPTGKTMHHFSSEYFKDKARNRDSGTSVQFRKNYELMLNPYLLFDTKDENAKQQHINEVLTNLGELEGSRRIQEAKDLYEEFQQIKQDHVNVEYGDRELTKQEETELETWVQQNSPISRIKFIEATKEKDLYNVIGKDNFLVVVPKRTSNGNDTGYYDKNFEKVQSNPAVYEFYHKMNDITNRAYKLFGQDTMLSSTSLAYVKQSTLAKLSKVGVAEFMKKDLMKNILDSLSGGNNPKEEIDPITKKPIKKIQPNVQLLDDLIKNTLHKKISAFKEERQVERLTENEYNKLYAESSNEIMNNTTFGTENDSLFASINQLNAAALAFSHSSMIEDLVNMCMTYLPNSTMNTGDDIIDDKGNTVGEKSINELKSMVEHTLDVMYYKNPKKDTSYPLYRLPDKEQKQKLKDLRSKLVDTKTTSEEREDIKAQIDTINKQSKAITVNSLLENLVGFIRLKGIGWNIPAAIANLTYGKITNMYKAVEGRMYTPKDWITAEGKIFTEWGKFKKLTENYNIIGDILYEFKQENKFEEKRGWFAKIIKAVKPYSMQTITEESNQGTVMIAMMLHQKVTNDKGEEKSLWDAIDKEGRLSDEWSIGNKTGQNALLDTIYNIKSQVQEIHGDYLNALMIKKNIEGRLISVFRMWFFEMYNSRFGPNMYDYNRKMQVKGRYRTMVDLAKTFGFSPKDIYRAYKAGTLSEVDSANLRGNLAELATMVISTALYAIAKAGICGDKEKCKGANLGTISLLNLSQKLNQDVAFYASPSAWKQFIGNPTAMTNMLGDMAKLLDISYNELAGDDKDIVYQNGPFKDHRKSLIWLENQIPLVNSLQRMKRYDESLTQNKNY